MVNLLIVDHNRLFAEGLQAAVESRKDGFAVTGVAWDVREAVRKIKDLRPGLILMSVRDSRQSTLVSLRSMVLQSQRVPVVLLSSSEHPAIAVEGLKAGIRGYLRMNLTTAQLLAALRSVVAGSVVLDPQCIPEIFQSLPGGEAASDTMGEPSGGTGQTSREIRKIPEVGEGAECSESPVFAVPRDISVPAWYDSLTRKERQILWFVVQDFQNEDIGEHLHLASQTVRNYVSRIYGKLGVENRSQAVRLARDSRLF